MPVLAVPCLFLSARDRAILAAARQALRGSRGDFGDALEALQEAVQRLIPAGRTYYLGPGAYGPIIGSILSGVGIAAEPGGVVVVRARPGAPLVRLGRLVP